jgi:hypothetical protein
MLTFTRCFIAVLLLMTFYSKTDAQQQATPKTVSPKMTADGVQAPLAVDGTPRDDSKLHPSSGSVRRTEPSEIRWARYTLPGTTVSIELPSEPYASPAPPVSEVPEGWSLGHFGTSLTGECRSL